MRVDSTQRWRQDWRANEQCHLWLWCVCWLFWLSFPAQAQYRFDHWTADNGLLQNSVRDIVQTRDGYLWLATFDGLVLDREWGVKGDLPMFADYDGDGKAELAKFDYLS